VITTDSAPLVALCADMLLTKLTTLKPKELQ
jgi:hypothetical protein